MRYVTGQEASLFEDSGLIPPDMFVIQPVAADVDDAEHGDGEFGVGWGHVGQEPGDGGGVSACKDEFVCLC